MNNGLRFSKHGLQIIDGFLPPSECARLLQLIDEYKEGHDLPFINRREASRSLRYRVIDGHKVYEHLPSLVQLYGDINNLVTQVSKLALVPLGDQAASVNVNITPPEGEYRWHYDRNAVTAILFLNEVAGGETEMYPNYRIHLGKYKDTRLQRWLDRLLRTSVAVRLFATKVSVAPRQGLLLIMRGDRCLHSVRRVEESKDRINVIMAYDVPGAIFRQHKDLDSYLYSQTASHSFDPNYRK